MGGSPPSVYALAVAGSDLYVGGVFSAAGAKPIPYIARAYLQSLPSLSMFHSGTDVIVSWPLADTDGFALEESALAAPAIWVSNSASVSDDSTHKWVTLPATNSPRFFRLRRP